MRCHLKVWKYHVSKDLGKWQSQYIMEGMPIGTATLESNLAAFSKIENACIIKSSGASSRCVC